MIGINPELIYDIGFQLSFLATAGLIYIQPIFKSRNLSLREGRMTTKQATVRKRDCFSASWRIAMTIIKTDNFSSSIAAFLATTPILLLNFGQFNLLSPLINLAILWVVPYILQIGMGLGILGLLGALGLKMAEIFSFLLYPLLFYLEKIIEISSKWTFFQLEGVKLGWW